MSFAKAITVVLALHFRGNDAAMMPAKEAPDGYQHFGQGHCLDEFGNAYSFGIIVYGDKQDHPSFQEAAADCPEEGLVGVEDEMYPADDEMNYCKCLYITDDCINGGAEEGSFDQIMFGLAGEGTVTSTTEGSTYSYVQCYKKESVNMPGEDEEASLKDIDVSDYDNDTTGGDIGPFQMMLFHDNYKWQGTRERRSWCIDCSSNSFKFWKRRSSDCEEGDEIQVRECNADNEEQWWMYSSGKFRSYTDDDLCWDYRKWKAYTLERCDSSSSTQTFGSGGYEEPHADSFNVNGNIKSQRFEIYPRKNPNICVTQHHHPRKGEQLKSQNCEIARKHLTSYWVSTAPPEWNGHSLDSSESSDTE